MYPPWCVCRPSVPCASVLVPSFLAFTRFIQCCLKVVCLCLTKTTGKQIYIKEADSSAPNNGADGTCKQANSAVPCCGIRHKSYASVSSLKLAKSKRRDLCAHQRRKKDTKCFVMWWSVYKPMIKDNCLLCPYKHRHKDFLQMFGEYSGHLNQNTIPEPVGSCPPPMTFPAQNTHAPNAISFEFPLCEIIQRKE